MLKLGFTTPLLVLLLATLTLGSDASLNEDLVENCDYYAVHLECGSECAPSGTCDFDICRLCCEQLHCPSYFASLCEANGDSYLYDGGGHCEAEGYGVLDACRAEQACRSASLVASLALLSLS